MCGLQPAAAGPIRRASMPDHDAPAEIQGPKPDTPAPGGEDAAVAPEIEAGSAPRLVKRTLTKPDGRHLILYDRRPR